MEEQIKLFPEPPREPYRRPEGQKQDIYQIIEITKKDIADAETELEGLANVSNETGRDIKRRFELSEEILPALRKRLSDLEHARTIIEQPSE